MQSGTIIAIGLVALGLVLLYVFRPRKELKEASEAFTSTVSIEEENEFNTPPVVKKKYVRKKKEISEQTGTEEGGESKQ